MSSTPRGPRTSLGQAAFSSTGTPPIGAPFAHSLGELEAAAERAERWAETARSWERVGVDRERTPAGLVRRSLFGRRDGGQG
jgi:hypothetical protein